MAFCRQHDIKINTTAVMPVFSDISTFPLAPQPFCIIQIIEHDFVHRTSHIDPSTTTMASPLDTAFTHRLLLAHLQAATSIATTFQNLPLFTPQPPLPAHQPTTTPTF